MSSDDAVADLDLVGGKHGVGAKILVQIETLRAFAQTCLISQTAIADGRARVLALWEAAQAENRAGMSRQFVTHPGHVDDFVAVGATYDAGLTELAREVTTAADAYEETERRNSSWETSGYMYLLGGLLGDKPATGQNGPIASLGDGITAWAQASFVNTLDAQERVEQVLDGKWIGWLLSGAAAKDGVNPSPMGLGGLFASTAAWYRNRRADIGDPVVGAAQPAPQGLADLYGTLTRNNPGTPNSDGRVVVQRIPSDVPGDSEQDRYVVTLPGTSDWEPPFPDLEPDIRDINAIGRGLSGMPSAEVDALPSVLERAGVPAGATVALVGHSLGGINAARAAADPTMRSRYNIKHVLTAGSPIQRIPVPEQTTVTSLKNNLDIVPKGAAAPDPDVPNRRTIRFTHPGLTKEFLAPHLSPTYVEAAKAVDERVAQARATATPSAVDEGYRDIDDSLRKDGFLGRSGQMSVTEIDLKYHEQPMPVLTAPPTRHW